MPTPIRYVLYIACSKRQLSFAGGLRATDRATGSDHADQRRRNTSQAGYRASLRRFRHFLGTPCRAKVLQKVPVPDARKNLITLVMLSIADPRLLRSGSGRGGSSSAARLDALSLVFASILSLQLFLNEAHLRAHHRGRGSTQERDQSSGSLRHTHPPQAFQPRHAHTKRGGDKAKREGDKAERKTTKRKEAHGS